MKLSSVLRLPALLAAALVAPAVVEAEHTSNWAVLVSTSRFWFNYRHLANVLSIYRTVKRLGIPDSQIILMLPDDMACNPRNAFPGTVYSNADRAVDLYGDNIEVDYRGYEVTVENFIRLLTDRVGDEMPRSKRLLTDDRSNILVYMTGHGGNEFLKFQDAEEIGAFDLADAFEQMWEKRRYHEILFMIDTCQANTMYSKLYSPNIIATGSSELDQSSYSHHADNDVGVAVIDRYTYYNLEFLETEVRDTSSKKTVGDLFDSYTYEKIHSHAGVRYDLFRGGAEAARSRLVTDFFGNVQNVEVDGSKNTTLEEDLLSLSRTIAALRQKADEEEAARADAGALGLENTTTTEQKITSVPKRTSQFAKPLTDENWWTKKIFGATTLAGLAADDSVHVLVPEFPDLAKRRQARKEKHLKQQRANGTTTTNGSNGTTNVTHYDDFGEDYSTSDEEDESSKARGNTRAQYSEGSKHMPVSYPPLDPRINRELYTAAGMPFPYDGAAASRAGGIAAAAAGVIDDDEDADSDAAVLAAEEDDSDESDDGDYCGGSHIPNRPFGAGYGPITGVGSSMNHVVHMAWSPSGLGINRRPILAILTGSGTLAMYGDGSTTANILPRANEGMLQHRELTSWMVLWGVGERLVVPGQQTDVSEYIRGFAWAKQSGPGQALLATVNDQQEVAILSVQTVYRLDDAKVNKASVPSMASSRETLVWLVQEVARFKAQGPHPKGKVTDPDWSPCGTSFGLKWTPWVQTEDAQTCILSFIDRNYIGFRRIRIEKPWVRGDLPKVVADDQDIFGKCLYLSTDAFVEFEDAIWKRGEITMCRGIAVTGFYWMHFNIAITGDLVIHPPDPLNPTEKPLYTLIRLSATATNPDWYETNVAYPDDDSPDGSGGKPQWVRDMTQKLEISVPADMHLRHGYGGGESDSEDDANSGPDDDDDDDDMMADDDYDEDGDVTAAVTQAPEVHPHRFRMHGLTVSPGGGATAVLFSQHSTQLPERGGWHTVRSTISFGYKPRWPRRRPPSGQQAPQRCASSTPENASLGSDNDIEIQSLTTEARLFEWLYGDGPPVPGVNSPSGSATTTTQDEVVSLSSEQKQLRELFKPTLEQQNCDLCGAKMIERKKGALSGCENGHYFGTCATSGLAVQIPGITRSCGTCGLRTIRTEVLAGKMPPEHREAILEKIGDGVCGGCGGKFLT
ncbi:gpi-anchor transamidase-like protein [Apodospora peruviana]|uniref:Gpi-anchor transamidase-like protein n=1 Tax=Apodospora peruviana TaxID=516989 RepID=A0AAE0M4C2_9PEZI|nr:gpi-anchor transamidase-like protein [Apodospora peruviana]